MAFADYLTSTNLGIIVGIVLIFILFWFLRGQKVSDRPSLERRMIQKDQELEGVDIQVRQDEKKLQHIAVDLYDAVSQLHGRAGQVGINLDERANDYNFIVETLELLWKATTNVSAAKELFDRMSPMIDRYLLNLPTQDPIIGALVNKIPKLKKDLHDKILIEYELLAKKMRLLRQDYQETAREKGASDRAA